MIKTILVCSDGSAHALKATEEAALIARQSNASVLLLHVQIEEEKPVHTYAVVWQIDPEPPPATAPASRQKTLVGSAERILVEAGVPYRVLHEQGHPAAQIVRVAERELVDLIVVGDQGDVTAASRLGVVSDQVVHQAHCSVLVVR